MPAHKRFKSATSMLLEPRTYHLKEELRLNRNTMPPAVENGELPLIISAKTKKSNLKFYSYVFTR